VTPLRVLVGAETYPPDLNGAARFAGRLAAGLAARGHEVHVVAPSPDGPPGREVPDGVVVHRVTSRRYRPLDALRVCMPWEAAREVARVVDRVAPDVVHTNGHLVVGRAVVAAARRGGLPLVATNHLMPENLVGYVPVPDAVRAVLGRWMWRDLGRVYGRAGVVTAPTPRAVDLLERRSGLTGAVAVSNGIDLERFGPRTCPGDGTRLLFVGRLDPEKRLEDLLHALALLPADAGARLEVIGDGARREAWARLAADLGIADRVDLRGRVDDADLLAAYARADVFCMPGVAELQSLVTLEAMASGLPVVAADAMALPHLVRPGVNGRLHPPGDAAALAGHLADLLADPLLRERYGAASRRLAVAHAVDATLDTFESLYQAQIARTRSDRRVPAW
jgi:glycosyltransferase involved in cell wall biosynthesis